MQIMWESQGGNKYNIVPLWYATYWMLTQNPHKWFPLIPFSELCSSATDEKSEKTTIQTT